MDIATSAKLHRGHGTPSQHDRHAKEHGQITNISRGERIVSVAAGLALLYAGMNRRRTKAAIAAAGGALLMRGVTGHSLLYRVLSLNTAGPLSQRGIRVAQSITIECSPAEVYRFWRHFENLPIFLEHLEDVEQLSQSRSQWRARLPGGKTLEWESELIEDYENQLISWQSLPGSQVNHAGSVRFIGFERLDGTGQATEVRLVMRYDPPGGGFGHLVARILGSDPQREVVHGLRKLKHLLEMSEQRGRTLNPDTFH